MSRRREKEREEKHDDKVLDVNASMQGTLAFNDPVNLRINGKFHGKLKTKGQLTVGEGAEVDATIDGEYITIMGKVKGNVKASANLTLMPTAVLQGDINVANLVVEEGAVFEGCCRMLTERMSAYEVAKYIDIEMDKIAEWAKEGKIPAEKENDRWSFDKRRIDVWLTEGR